MADRLLDPEVENSFRELPEGEREALSSAISEIARVLIGGSAAEIVALEETLRRDWRSTDSIEELEARNRLRVFARYREIGERSLVGSELQEQLGVSRQRLGQMREKKQLLGVRLPIHRELHYPLWQFGEEGRPLGALPRLIEAAEEGGIGALALDSLMTNPAAADEGEGRTPADLLRIGDREAKEHVLRLVRAALPGGT